MYAEIMGQNFSKLLLFISSAIWLANGLFCKVLNLVPRHQQVVARILGTNHAALITTTIGVLEILMAVWIISRIKHRWCVVMEIVLIATMNTLEAILAPDLLLFGRGNAALALLLIAVLYWAEYKSGRPAVTS